MAQKARGDDKWIIDPERTSTAGEIKSKNVIVAI